MEVLELDPTTIKVKDGLDRFRGEMGDIKRLAKSFQDYRQILPIIITREHYLIDGGRRLAACILNKQKVKAVYEDVVDDTELRELELEANLHRKDYTPAERAAALVELHKRKQERFGKGTSGASGGHTIEDTAKILGMSKSAVIQEFKIANMVEAFPQLKGAKTKSQIMKAAKGLEKLMECSKGVKKNEKYTKEGGTLFDITCEDAIEHMKAQEDKSVDILLTDPLYGIDADKLGISTGGITGGFSARGYKIKDEKDYALFHYIALAAESFRFCTDKAHGYIFLAPEHFSTVRGYFIEAGWRVHVKPLIWIKKTTGQCNVPTAWPSSCYEMIMYIRKDSSKLVIEGQPDWIMIDPVNATEKIHDYEKPVPLLENLLRRCVYSGQLLYDPYMGSGSSIEAGIKQGLRCLGCDNSHEAYSLALDRLVKLEKSRE